MFRIEVAQIGDMKELGIMTLTVGAASEQNLLDCHLFIRAARLRNVHRLKIT
jgi:hypothetical protein